MKFLIGMAKTTKNDIIFLSAYGMKLALGELQFLNSIKTSVNSTSRYNIGVNVDTNYTPLFKVSPGNEGKIYPILSTEFGSVCINLQTPPIFMWSYSVIHD